MNPANATSDDPSLIQIKFSRENHVWSPTENENSPSSFSIPLYSFLCFVFFFLASSLGPCSVSCSYPSQKKVSPVTQLYDTPLVSLFICFPIFLFFFPIPAPPTLPLTHHHGKVVMSIATCPMQLGSFGNRPSLF